MSTATETFEEMARDADEHLISLLRHAERIGEQLQDSHETQATIKFLVTAYARMVQGFYDAYKATLKSEDPKDYTVPGNVRASLHRAIEKLSDEWVRIAQILPAAMMAQDQIAMLTPVVHAAKQDVGLAYERVAVVPQFGLHFELVSFKYAPNVVILGIPVFNLDTPWEWSVIWHEVAGHKVRQLKDEDTATFENMRPKDENGRPLEKWSADWMEELFEDSCSAHAFGAPFIPVFERILNRYPPEGDGRHPPSAIRLSMAKRVAGVSAEPLPDPADQQALERAFENIRAALPSKATSELVERVRREIVAAMHAHQSGQARSATPGPTEPEKGAAPAQTKDDIAKLLKGKEGVSRSSRELWELALSETDFASPSGHTHSSDPVTLEFRAHTNQKHLIQHRNNDGIHR